MVGNGFDQYLGSLRSAFIRFKPRRQLSLLTLKLLFLLSQNWTFFLVIFALSFANASYLFNSRRRYDMRFRNVSLFTESEALVVV
jgi:hypothetical protein